ncbi:hypothetical protein CEE37_04035 [candidate division LCP-89 bacterium B3_LCP]|uniref:Uncharacterized protein n=1 Tax=candidate division LCP-89 bacterium B3_LCP TaxID=2012998 RepID=A0A532V432_UNCL8|nr:MAG: hypothetical protein CEE37_04035 [candidate division LCP-89 bacterium B3_LCP]
MEMRTDPPQKILICRTDRLGDVILALPCATLIKRLFPNCRVSFLVQSYTLPIVRIFPQVDQILGFDRRVSTRQFAEVVRKEEFDAAIVLFPEYKLVKGLKIAGIRHRAGIAYRWYSHLFTHRHREHRKHNLKHEVEYNLSLTYSSFQKHDRWEDVLDPETVFPIQFIIHQQESREITTTLKAAREVQRKVIALHPGGSGSAHRWPGASYRELAASLAHKTDSLIVLTGNEEEIELCHWIALSAEGNVLNLSGQLTLEGLAAVYNNCDLLVTNSTGPLHLARAIGTPVIGLFPSDKAMTPVRWGPYRQQGSVIKAPECVSMNDITVDMVFDKVIERAGEAQ